MPVVSLAELLEAGVHFGHQTRRWNPKMRPYIFTDRNGIHIIDLVQTAAYMEEAYEYVRKASDDGKRFLFVGTKRQAAGIVAQEALRCGSYYINQRWLGGILTNWNTIKTRTDRLKELEEMQASGLMDRLPKKEGSMRRREMEKLQKYLGGIKTMRRIPDVVIMVDQRREMNAVQECRKLNIPIVSLLDSNCDPDHADIFVPANDDAIRSIKLIVGKLADAIYEGRHGQLETMEQFDYEGAMDIENYEDDAYVEADAVPAAAAAEVAAEVTAAAKEAVSEEAASEEVTPSTEAVEAEATETESETTEATA
ncbi:MAG: 30S ribosomal protein S2 [Cyanobacteria bacterium P01_E01_bin.45]